MVMNPAAVLLSSSLASHPECFRDTAVTQMGIFISRNGHSEAAAQRTLLLCGRCEKMLSSEQNDEECDATDDAMKN